MKCLKRKKRNDIVSKINFPEETGIFTVVEKPINDTIKDLDAALNQCSMSVPSSFSYLNYLRSLPGVISDYTKRANEILVSAKNVDNNFIFAFENIDSTYSTLNSDVLESRDRLVK